ncbi:MAG: hypothetical protein ACTSYD_03640 [Candidatus Heimdallarchaeaceae archaeon]
MSDIELKIEVLSKEAEANFKADRFKDAARTFEHLMTLSLQADDPEEALYYAYRAADCWKNDQNLGNRALVFKQVGEIAFMVCSSLALKMAENAKNDEEKAKYLYLAGDCLRKRDKQKAKTKLKESLALFEKLISEEKNPEEKIQLMLSALGVQEKLGGKASINKLKRKLATLYVKYAQEEEKEKEPENLQRALRAYEDAEKLYKELDLKEDIKMVSKHIKKLKSQVEDYDPFKV